jgi:hypothetical protein
VTSTIVPAPSLETIANATSIIEPSFIRLKCKRLPPG